jgi:hypothetical protein
MTNDRWGETAKERKGERARGRKGEWTEWTSWTWWTEWRLRWATIFGRDELRLIRADRDEFLLVRGSRGGMALFSNHAG